MGRELKRVALDFEWPLDKVWEGYLNPYYEKKLECPHCDGSGSTPEAKFLADQWYGKVPFKPEDRGSVPYTSDHPVVMSVACRNVAYSPSFYGEGSLAVLREAERLVKHLNRGWNHHLNELDVAALLEAGRLWDFTRHWDSEARKWVDNDPVVIPTPQQVNDWSLSGMGHDSINQWAVVGAECERRGIVSSCPHCDGEGATWPSKEDEAACEAWVKTEPPVGEGWQMWETVSEGSPISPVFETPEELAGYMTGRKWGGDDGTPYETWLTFITKVGFSVSLIGTSEGILDGVTASVKMLSETS